METPQCASKPMHHAILVEIISMKVEQDCQVFLVRLIKHEHHPQSSTYADMKNPEVEKELRFVTTFSKITKEKFWKAMSNRLTPLLSKASHFPETPFAACTWLCSDNAN